MKYWPKAIWGRKEFIWLIGDSHQGKPRQEIKAKVWHRKHGGTLLIIAYYCSSCLGPIAYIAWALLTRDSTTYWATLHQLTIKKTYQKTCPKANLMGSVPQLRASLHLCVLVCVKLTKMEQDTNMLPGLPTMLSIFRVRKKNNLTNTAGLWEILGVRNDSEEDLSIWLQSGAQLSSGNKSCTQL